MTAEKPHPRSYGLIRVSTAKQEKSAEAQEAMIDAHAKKLDAEYMGVRADPDTSATKVPFLQRNAVKIITAKLNPGDHVIIWKLDRVARTMRDICDVMDWVKQHDIHFQVINFGDRELDLGSDIGEMIAYALTMGARMESRMASIRTKEMLAYLKNAGAPYHSRPKLGYRRIWGRHTKGTKKHTKKLDRYDWDQGEWQLLYEMCHRHSHGESYVSVLRDYVSRGERRAEGALYIANYAHRQRFRRAYHMFRVALENDIIEIKDGKVIPTEGKPEHEEQI